MSTLTITTENRELLGALKALLSSFKGTFEIEETDPYDPEYVAMIKESLKQADMGETVKLDSVSKLWDLANTH